MNSFKVTLCKDLRLSIYSIAKISWNTEKSSGNMRRLLVTQNPMKKSQADAGVKNPQGVVCFISVSLFNSISVSKGYLIPKPPF